MACRHAAKDASRSFRLPKSCKFAVLTGLARSGGLASFADGAAQVQVYRHLPFCFADAVEFRFRDRQLAAEQRLQFIARHLITVARRIPGA